MLFLIERMCVRRVTFVHIHNIINIMQQCVIDCQCRLQQGCPTKSTSFFFFFFTTYCIFCFINYITRWLHESVPYICRSGRRGIQFIVLDARKLWTNNSMGPLNTFPRPGQPESLRVSRDPSKKGIPVQLQDATDGPRQGSND